MEWHMPAVKVKAKAWQRGSPEQGSIAELEVGSQKPAQLSSSFPQFKTRSRE